MVAQGETYKHYKGTLYKIITVGRHTETKEELVVYRSHADQKIWIRPLDIFNGNAEVNGNIVKRFTKIER